MNKVIIQPNEDRMLIESCVLRTSVSFKEFKNVLVDGNRLLLVTDEIVFAEIELPTITKARLIKHQIDKARVKWVNELKGTYSLNSNSITYYSYFDEEGNDQLCEVTIPFFNIIDFTYMNNVIIIKYEFDGKINKEAMLFEESTIEAKKLIDTIKNKITLWKSNIFNCYILKESVISISSNKFLCTQNYVVKLTDIVDVCSVGQIIKIEHENKGIPCSLYIYKESNMAAIATVANINDHIIELKAKPKYTWGITNNVFEYQNGIEGNYIQFFDIVDVIPHQNGVIIKYINSNEKTFELHITMNNEQDIHELCTKLIRSINIWKKDLYKGCQFFSNSVCCGINIPLSEIVHIRCVNDIVRIQHPTINNINVSYIEMRNSVDAVRLVTTIIRRKKELEKQKQKDSFRGMDLNFDVIELNPTYLNTIETNGKKLNIVYSIITSVRVYNNKLVINYYENDTCIVSLRDADGCLVLKQEIDSRINN